MPVLLPILLALLLFLLLVQRDAVMCVIVLFRLLWLSVGVVVGGYNCAEAAALNGGCKVGGERCGLACKNFVVGGRVQHRVEKGLRLRK